METWEYCIDKQTEAVQEFIDSIPVEAIEAARESLFAEVCTLCSIIAESFSIRRQDVVRLDDNIAELDKLDRWLCELC